MIEKEISDFFARRRVVGDYFRNDILRARNCLVRRLDFFRYVFFRFPSYVQSFILREDGVRQRLSPFATATEARVLRFCLYGR